MRSFKVLVLLTLLAAVPILAAEEPTRVAANPLAAMHTTPDSVSWEAEAGLGDLELAVAGPDGAVVRRQFAAGEAPTLDLYDARGERLPDGMYTYELRVTRELGPGRSLLFSGSLAIRDGSFVDLEGLSERPREGLKGIVAADEVISDDLIVQGGACIGFECADGENMAAQLKVKSQSPGIEFDDTGGGLSGNNDWRILLNGPFTEESFKIEGRDPDTGFYVPFTIVGGAPDHSLYVSGSGNIGLGTSIPDAKLHVPSGEVRIPGGTASANGWPTHFRWFADGRNYIRGTTLMADDGGSVGIGTSAPASKLHVNGGDIRVSGGSFIDDGVTLFAPDYVFEPDYDLMPLAELAAFVRAEKHLPNVPKAAEIRASGLNLSQFQMRLLEKIEELTLYTLAQQEQIAALAAKLEALEAK